VTPATSPATQRRQRAGREYAAVLLLGLVSAGFAVMATTGGRSWATATVSADGLPPRVFVASARSVAPWTTAAALVALAGLGAVLATAGRWRRVVGTIVAAAGLVVVAGAVLSGSAVDSVLRDDIAATTSGADAAAVDSALDDLSGGGWRWLALAGGVGIAGAGVATVLRGPGWPVMGRRYEAPTAARRPQDETDLWRAQDRGDDPTAPP